MIIGITGTDGAGKGTVVDYLVDKKGFAHYSSRTEIVKEIQKQGLPETRAQMRLTANEMRAREGNGVLVNRALGAAAEAGVNRAVIESIRALAEVDALEAAGGILLAVDADQALRYERVQARRASSDHVTYEEFQAHEEMEKNDPDPHGMQKGLVMERAKHTFYNNGTVGDLYQQVEKFCQQYGL